MEEKRRCGKRMDTEQPDEKEAVWWLAQTPGWGAVKLRQLAELLGSPLQIWEQIQELGMRSEEAQKLYQRLTAGWSGSRMAQEGEKLRIRPDDLNRLLLHGKTRDQCGEAYHYWKSRGIRIAAAGEAEYPGRLLPLYDRPFALYVRGRLPREEGRTAAVIGARACSGYGAFEGRRLARELAAEGVQIISGLAYGVDSEGHWGALEAGVPGAAFAVLGCGVDQYYPREHEKLAERILANGGGLISEFPPGTAPVPRNFPMRNRIISGLSDCILVIEARRKSGSLITVDQALDQGKEIFALPGRVGDKLSEGCHQLIRNGAALLTGSEDVLRYLYPERRTGREKGCTGEQKMDQCAVYSCLDHVGKSLEEILCATGLPLSQVRRELLELLMEDQIAETAAGYYAILE